MWGKRFYLSITSLFLIFIFQNCSGRPLQSQLAGQYLQLPETHFMGLNTFTKVTTSNTFSCGLNEAQQLKCWGFIGQFTQILSDPQKGYYFSETTQPSSESLNSLIPKILSQNIIDISAEMFSLCYLEQNKTVHCVGAKNPDLTLTSVAAITSGNDHTCALLENTQVVCWGANNRGQLGNNSIIGGLNPVSVLTSEGVPLSGVVKVKAGGTTTCALLNTQEVYCWGGGAIQMFGMSVPGSIVSSLLAVKLSLSSDRWIDLDLGYDHLCLLSDRRMLKCVGNDNYRQAASCSVNTAVSIFKTSQFGTYYVTEAEPQRIYKCQDGLSSTDFIEPVLNLSVSDYHDCLISQSKKIYCKGKNEIGSIGDGTKDPSPNYKEPRF